jgi:hypothetical protein
MSNAHQGALNFCDGAVLLTVYRAYMHTGSCTKQQVDKSSTTQPRLDSFNVLQPFPLW